MARLELTSREKIGQLFMVGFLGTSVTPDLAAFLKDYKPGGVILFSRNLESVEQIVQLTNDLQQCSPKSPLLISIDQEGGRVSRLPKGFTIFPPCELIGQCHSGELAYAAAATIAKELRAVGINMNMAPVLDVNSNPDNPSSETGPSAPRLKPSSKWDWSPRGSKIPRVVACGKHFPAMATRTPIRTRSCRWLRRHESGWNRRVSSVSPCRRGGNRDADDSACPLQGAG